MVSFSDHPTRAAFEVDLVPLSTIHDLIMDIGSRFFEPQFCRPVFSRSQVNVYPEVECHTQSSQLGSILGLNIVSRYLAKFLDGIEMGRRIHGEMSSSFPPPRF